MIDTLAIERFRGLRELTVSGLGRVDLVVGKHGDLEPLAPDGAPEAYARDDRDLALPVAAMGEGAARTLAIVTAIVVVRLVGGGEDGRAVVYDRGQALAAGALEIL